MYWSNYHSHSSFCDGRSSMEDFVKFAIAKKIKKYGFSSHAPLPFLTKWTMIEGDFEDYQIEFQRLKQKYADQIELYIGLEIDYIHRCSDIGNDFFKTKNVDYKIGSIHYLDKLDEDNYWSIDGEYSEFNKGLMILFDGDIQSAVKRFFEITSFMITKGKIDIVGHFDKIIMHALKYSDFKLEDKWYIELLTIALQQIKEKNLILEINTKSLKDRGITYPHQNFYSLIYDLKIPIVVNSDCHYPTNVIDGFVPTYKALKLAGFKTMQQLINGKWQPIEFNENGLLYE